MQPNYKNDDPERSEEEEGLIAPVQKKTDTLTWLVI